MSARDDLSHKDIFFFLYPKSSLLLVFVEAFLFRTVEGKNQSGGEDSLSSLTISDALSKTGVNVNYQKEPALSKCKENQIYLMDKQKMFLVSSEKIVHDISGWINMMILGL